MNFTLYNVMSCEGFSREVGGGCTQAWVGMAILFFIIAFTRKWIGEEMGVDFNFIGGLAGGYAAFIAVVSISGSTFWSVIAGVVGMAVLGFGIGLFAGEEGDSY